MQMILQVRNKTEMHRKSGVLNERKISKNFNNNNKNYNVLVLTGTCANGNKDIYLSTKKTKQTYIFEIKINEN